MFNSHANKARGNNKHESQSNACYGHGSANRNLCVRAHARVYVAVMLIPETDGLKHPDWCRSLRPTNAIKPPVRKENINIDDDLLGDTSRHTYIHTHAFTDTLSTRGFMSLKSRHQIPSGLHHGFLLAHYEVDRCSQHANSFAARCYRSTHKTTSEVKPGGTNKMSGFLRSRVVMKEISVDSEKGTFFAFYSA